jgi:hypothetical protein
MSNNLLLIHSFVLHSFEEFSSIYPPISSLVEVVEDTHVSELTFLCQLFVILLHLHSTSPIAYHHHKATPDILPVHPTMLVCREHEILLHTNTLKKALGRRIWRLSLEF